MRRKIFFIILFILCFSLYSEAVFCENKIKVVASTLDMADFVKQIGGDKVSVYAISHGQYDLHFFEPKPSQVIQLKNADMLVVGGLGIDPWITSLIDASRNPKINYGGIGFVDPAQGVKALDVPTTRITGAMGDVHPYGNPHFWFSPENIEIALDNIMAGLIRLSPQEVEYFESNKDKYIMKVKQEFDKYKQELIPFKGICVLQYHSSWDYFCGYFGLKLAGSVEPKPGIPPMPSHLRALVKRIEEKDVKLILAEPYYSAKPLVFLETNTNVKVLQLPLYLGGNTEFTTFLDNLGYTINQITMALKEGKEK